MKYRKEMPHGDIKNLDFEQVKQLCVDLRDLIVETVSKNGGHLASNLGVVELSVALHRVFDFPNDNVIFDVGHQSYVHKLLSGRVDNFGTLRMTGGISGFQSRSESRYDCFGGGHSGTSISAALGFAQAAKLRGDTNHTIAVVGDGSFTNGMIHEALNNASDKDLNLIIILNDNEMSISKNIGGLSRCFGKLRSSAKYYRLKRKFKHRTSKMRLIGRPIAAFGRGFKNLVKRLVWKSNFFENLGVDYMGPVDGHNIRKLESILEEAKFKKGVTIVHVCTQKGKGYELAEKHPDLYHSVSAFDPKVGISDSHGGSGSELAEHTFSDVFGQTLAWYANTNTELIAITAAMCDGTGLTQFKKSYPDRFFDVGIAEEHAVTFSAGLAAAGMRPVFAVYSSFLQRGYDQIIHDVAIQGLPVVFAIDRAGLVPGDGVTHQGIFDCAFLMSIPGLTVYSVESFKDMGDMLNEALKSNGPVAIRYPKGGETEYPREEFIDSDGYRICSFSAIPGKSGKRVCLITYGRLTKQLYDAAVRLSDTYSVRVVSITRIMPLNFEGIMQICSGADYVYFVEEQIKTGGVGELLLSQMALVNSELPPFEINAITEFPKHGTLNDLFELHGFSAAKIESHVRNALADV